MTNFLDKLKDNIRQKQSYLCVGLDTDYEKLPVKSGNVFKSILNFNKIVIDNTSDLVCCYKINSAFYEKYGAEGIEILKKTINYINETIPVILDAKRCDIGNSSKYYAQYAFEYLEADAVTVIPYMGIDAIEPFFKYEDKFVFVLAISSNPGGADFQMFPAYNPLYMKIIKKVNKEFSNAGFVCGATRPEFIKKIRKKGINNPLLIPGLGTQGGDTKKTVEYALLNDGIGIFNVSRGIIYAGEGKKYYKTVREKTEEYKSQVSVFNI